jgi:hypothetical protein
LLAGFYAFLFWYVDASQRPRLRRYLVKLLAGSYHFLAHLSAIALLWWGGLAPYAPVVIALGALLGGTIWGLYGSIAMIVGRMHAGDAFAALRLTTHRNFLRFKFEPGKLTIYPLAIDKPLHRHDWKRPPRNRPGTPTHVPAKPIPVRIIEGPIVVTTGRA